jgi:simple sugar transport system permease protein
MFSSIFQERPYLRGISRALIVIGATSLVLPLLGINIFGSLPSLYRGTLGNPYSLAQTLTVMAVVLLTGAAALVPFRAGFVNLGGEGQLTIGATATAIVVLSVGESGSLATAIAALFAAGIAGAAWGGIASFLYEKFGANEVISTLMLNFISFAVAGYFISTVWPDNLAPQTSGFPAGSSLPNIDKFGGAFYAIGIAIVVWLFTWWLIDRTNFGFRIRATGENAFAALRFGYAPVRTRVISVLLGGMFAGLAGGLLILVINRALILGISSSYGYVGIAAVLLIGLRPALLPVGAATFALIAVGGNTLAVVAQVSPSVSLVGVSVCVLVLLATRSRNIGGASLT